MFDKLSEELKAARIRSGLSLQLLAAKTRIDLKFLENIEDGNFSFLPELYVKAFLKEHPEKAKEIEAKSATTPWGIDLVGTTVIFFSVKA